MMRIILILLAAVISSCSSYTLTTDFFEAYDYSEIDDIDTTNMFFSEHMVDDCCPEWGSITQAVSKLKLRYKSSKRYRVALMGKHKTSVCKDRRSRIEHIDSVYLTGIIIAGKNRKTIIFRKSDDRQEIKSPIPLKILKILREDFVKINKLTQYNLGEEKRKYLHYGYTYYLYEQ